MPKIHIVREAFSLNGKDYARGDEISDADTLMQAQANHAHHLNATPHEMVVALPPAQAAAKKSDAV